jgi:hypothetical protein
MQTLIIVLTAIMCSISGAVAIWTIRDARKRYPKKPKDTPGQ